MHPTWKTGRLTITSLTDNPLAGTHTFQNLRESLTDQQLTQFGTAIGHLTDAPFEAAVLQTVYQYRY